MNLRREDLPVSIGNVKDLKYLNLSDNHELKHLPNSIGDLIKLQTLKLSNCWSLTQLPEGISRLINLRHLDLSQCSRLTHLPDGIGGLIQLRHLDLRGCEKLTHLPDGIGGLIQLRHLDLRGREKVTLRYLDVSGRESLTRLPNDITGLVKLEHLHLECCHQSRQLPNGLGQLVNLRNFVLQSFVMGPADGQRIAELKRVNGLKGELKIYGLENVRDATEATEAILKEKKLSSLWLFWGSSQAALESPQSSDEAEAVLEALQPPKSLNEELFIKGYSGSVFPRWMELLHNLVRIELKDCINCERLPPLGQLLHLKELIIEGMRSLKCTDTEIYSSSGGHTIFPSLVKLRIADMPKLEKWEDVEMKDSQQTEACPRLIEVNIQRCGSLKSLPGCLRNPSSLEKLDFYNCDQLELSSEDFQSLISLQVLRLTNLPKLTSFPALQHFSKLKWLFINGCSNLRSLGPQGMMQNPTVLEEIVFVDCEQLELSSTDFQHLLQLQEIRIEGLPKLTSFPALQHFSKLKRLEIRGCKNLISLRPQGTMQNPTTVLEQIKFKDCEQLELSSTDFQHLLELQQIHLEGLPKLTSFPALQHFSKRERLEIKGCKNVISLGPQGMMQNPTTVLWRIEVGDCEQLELSSADFHHLLELRTIHLSSLPKLTSLPQLEHLPFLEELQISRCKNLKILPHSLQNITSLATLKIKECGRDLEIRRAKDHRDYEDYWHSIQAISYSEFVVGGEDGQRITELKLLNGLEGELSIKGLENVRDATEATQVMLKEEKKLLSLCLIWGSSQESDEAVLEALQPPESLNEKLVINGYGGSVFPTWMQLVHNVVRIELRDCINCERLPPLGQLVHLRDLTIDGMRSLKCIDAGFYGSSGGRTIFPSLVSLTIEDMPKLEEWEDSQQTEACPCLEELNIQRCESLKSLPECLRRNLSNLRALHIGNCEQLELSSEDLQSLSGEWMDLTNLPKLTSFPALQHFSRIYRVKIKSCKNLISLGPQGTMQNPTVLIRIEFEDCEQLELSSTDFQHLHKLTVIQLKSLPKLTSLPQLQHLPDLERLTISKCKNLKILPHWLQNITSLRRLKIKGCDPDLELRCAKHTGEYWPFIKHIPKVIIQAGEET